VPAGPPRGRRVLTPGIEWAKLAAQSEELTGAGPR